MNARVASRIYSSAPNISPAIRADAAVMLPFLPGPVFASVIWAVAMKLDLRRDYSPPVEAVISIVLVMGTIIFWVLLSAMVLQPVVTERAQDTLRQLLAQPSNRRSIWLHKTGLTLLLAVANFCFSSLCLFFAFSTTDGDTMWKAILLIAVLSLVLCSTGSLVSLYLKSGAALLTLMALLFLYLAISMLLESLPSYIDKEAFWIFTIAWCTGSYALSYRLFQDIEVQ